MSDAVSYELDGRVAVVRIDDGKANALSPSILTALDEALDRATDEAHALVLLGRDGKFSAGFELSVMTESLESMRSLVLQGGRFLMRLYALPMPTVAGCTGHALAAGALTLLACDVRVGADVPSAKIGLNEVAIGMALPIFAVELARDRLSRRHLHPATVLGRIHDPYTAADAGFLDEVVPVAEVQSRALAAAHGLAELSTGAVGTTKAVLRRATIDHVLATIEDDLASITGPAERG